MKKVTTIFFLLSISLLANSQNYQSFSKSKKQLLKQVYISHKETFYCKNPYEIKQIKGKEKAIIIPTPAKYTPRKPKTRKGKINQRAKRVEWEHIMPMENAGRQMLCWRSENTQCRSKNGKNYKGRKCCKKVSPQFKIIESDMHNLVPSIGEVNGDRSNFRFMENKPSKKQYGACPFQVDFKERKAYPANYTKGFIARAYLYMSQKYNIKLSSQQLKMMEIWNKKYPPTEWEKIRNQKIKKIQGNSNQLIKNYK